MTSRHVKPDRFTRFLRALNAACVAGLLIIFALGVSSPRSTLWWLLAPVAGSTTYVILTSVILGRPRKPVTVTAAEPRLEIREARYPDPIPGQKGKTCRICGMSDPERFRLKVGVRMWGGWPSHDTCVEWLENGPKPSVTASPAPGTGQKCKACYSRPGYIGDDGMCSPCRSSEILHTRAARRELPKAGPPTGRPYLEPGANTAPPGCLCHWRETTGGYLVIDSPSAYGLSLPSPRRCEIHDRQSALTAHSVTMAEFAERLDVFADRMRQAFAVPHAPLGECDCGQCNDDRLY